MTRNALAALSALALLMAAPALAQQTPTAQADIMDAEGRSLGVLTLTETDGGVDITGELTDVPEGEHGFHFHTTGTCDGATQFESAGDHFNPDTKQHGTQNPQGPHAGDMMNIEANADGEVMVEVRNEMVTLSDGANSLLDADGTALLVHADPDDYMTDPSGNSGDRIACGVIEGAAS